MTVETLITIQRIGRQLADIRAQKERLEQDPDPAKDTLWTHLCAKEAALIGELQ